MASTSSASTDSLWSRWLRRIFNVLEGGSLKEDSLRFKKIALPFSTTCFYLSNVMNTYLAYNAAVEGDWKYSGQLVFSLVAPGVFHAMFVWDAMRFYRIVGCDFSKPNTRALQESPIMSCILSCLNLNRAMDAWRILKKGVEPFYYFSYVDRCLNLTFQGLPLVSANVNKLLTTERDLDVNDMVVVASTLWAIFSGAFGIWMGHTLCDDIVNCPKYRVWDVKSHPVAHRLIVFLIDLSATGYRLLMFTMIYTFCGPLVVLPFFVCPAVIQYVQLGFLPRICLCPVPIALISEVLAAIIADHLWLEPPAVQQMAFSPHIVYPMRLLQFASAVFAIAMNWSKHEEFNPLTFRYAIGASLSFALAWFTLFAFFSFYLVRDAVEEIQVKRDAFLLDKLKIFLAKKGVLAQEARPSQEASSTAREKLQDSKGAAERERETQSPKLEIAKPNASQGSQEAGSTAREKLQDSRKTAEMERETQSPKLETVMPIASEAKHLALYASDEDEICIQLESARRDDVVLEVTDGACLGELDALRNDGELDAPRQSAEDAQGELATLRQRCEAYRQSSEETKRQLEALRHSCEVQRQSAEVTERQLNALRQSSEAHRQTAEMARNELESARLDLEREADLRCEVEQRLTEVLLELRISKMKRT